MKTKAEKLEEKRKAALLEWEKNKYYNIKSKKKKESE